MAEPTPQNYENHRRFVPLYHFAVFVALGANVVAALYSLVTGPSVGTAIGVTTALSLVGVFLYARLFALAAQDRVIRLEERLRLTELLPDDLRARVDELTTAQLIALRFASDGELASLVRQVLDEKIADREEIKKRIKNWRPDLCRV